MPPEKMSEKDGPFTTLIAKINTFSTLIRTPIRILLLYETLVHFITVPDVLCVDKI